MILYKEKQRIIDDYLLHTASFADVEGEYPMELQLRILPAEKCSKNDVIAALDIYCKSVDPGSLTDTNQIKDYIWNSRKHKSEKRRMFFFLLYDGNGNVEGFSEFAYLPDNQILMLDYLCTRKRNHMLFYSFYHMVTQSIKEELQRAEKYIRYIITELSLTQVDGKLIDVDSNYFRHLLSNENYQLLKYPYYQPPLLSYENPSEFSLAIKLLSVDNGSNFILKKEQYLSILKEIYYSHYLVWHNNFNNNEEKAKFSKTIAELFTRIQKEIPKNQKYELISLIQCNLFEEGQCPKFTAENITIPRQRKSKWKAIGLTAVWIILACLTFIVCLIPQCSRIVSVLCSFLTIIAGIISIFALRRDIFGQK